MKKELNKNIVLSITSVLFISGLTGCASYRASALANLSEDLLAKYPSQVAGVEVTAKAFTQDDCKRYLDRDVLSKGYQPVQVFIQNNSNKSLYFSLRRVSLPYARPEEVVKSVRPPMIVRIAEHIADRNGEKLARVNQSLDDDFCSKAAKDQTLSPHSYINALIFIPVSRYSNQFTITLIDYETRRPILLHVHAS